MAEIVNTENFEEIVLRSDKPVLVDFFATWCGPCSMMAPVLAELSETYDTFRVVKVDIDESMPLAERYGIMSVPTFAAFKNGAEIGRSIGVQTKDALLKLMAL
ncbi:MAG: thioredoxin [bacterium]|nr:thioredoxin [bacterium]